MSQSVAIATADPDLFAVIRAHLVSAGHPGITDESLEPAPLADCTIARDWLVGPNRVLLVIDAELPSGPTASRDRSKRGEGVKQLHQDIDGTTFEATPRLVITPSRGVYREIEATCTRNRHAIALPMGQLHKHRQDILRPFLAMLLDKKIEGKIPGTFRVIEVDFGKMTSRCQLGFGQGPLLLWEASQRVDPLRKAAEIFDNESFYKSYRWPLVARQNGELLFTDHVIEALGEELFGHIEDAAGGLEGLSFRYEITDESLYLAPFEASVRPITERAGPFVLLKAPLARKLPITATIRSTKAANARMPTPTRILAIRSQMGEHPDGPTTGDNYALVLPAPEGGGWRRRPAQFSRLDNIDVELAALLDIADTRPNQLVLHVADLSDMTERKPGETAADYLGRKLKEHSYDVVHYAGHAWSDLNNEAHLILPGTERGEASGLTLSTFAAFPSLAETRLVYLSACRGISRGTVQTLVDYGIPHGIGFRYQVEDKKAAQFAETFYKELFDGGFVPTAFCAACAAARGRLLTDDESPIWLSPVLVAQPADWAMRA